MTHTQLAYDSDMFSARCHFHSAHISILKDLQNTCSRNCGRHCLGIKELKEKASVLGDNIYIMRKGIDNSIKIQ